MKSGLWTRRNIRQLLGAGLTPAVAFGATAAMVTQANAQPIEHVLPEGDLQSSAEASLCSPIFGATQKEIGIPIIIEDAQGSEITSVSGLTFELVAENGETQVLPDGLVSDDTRGTGQITELPRLAIHEYQSQNNVTMLPPQVKWLNCSPLQTEVAVCALNGCPGDSTPAPFPQGTQLVAKRNGTVVASGDVSGKQAVDYLKAVTVLEVQESFYTYIFSNLDLIINPVLQPPEPNSITGLNGVQECPVTENDWRAIVTGPLGLEFESSYFDFWSAICQPNDGFNVALSQLYYRDAPLGLLSDIGLKSLDVSPQAILDIKSAGIDTAVRLTAPPVVATTTIPATTTTTAVATVKKKTGVLPATGSENSIAVAIAAVMLGGALVVASRRRLLNK